MNRPRREAAKHALISTWDRIRSSRTPATPRAVVLCYHSIHPDRSFASATPSAFNEHLAWLTDNFRVLPLAPDAFAIANDLSPSDETVVMLTFDDGYDDNYDYAFPALVRHNVRATFFVTTGLLEQHEATVARFQRERACPPEDLRPMSWPQMREMRDAGMLFGSHTHTHRNLASLGSSESSEELRVSKHILEQGLGASVNSLAYPYGKPRVHFNETTRRLAREQHYEVAAAVLARNIRTSDSPLGLPRFIATRDDIGNLDAKIRGAYDVIGSWQERTPMRLQRLVSPADFGH